jgi:hypothetical protein
VSLPLATGVIGPAAAAYIEVIPWRRREYEVRRLLGLFGQCAVTRGSLLVALSVVGARRVVWILPLILHERPMGCERPLLRPAQLSRQK